MTEATPWAHDFARKHKLTLRFETPLPGKVPAYKYEDGDLMVVVLDSSLPDERQHFSLAHEAAHLILGHTGDVSPQEEQEANFLASELLLPDPPFSDFAYENLRGLKDAFPQASFEALARRRQQFIPSVLTIMDDGLITRRLTSDEFSAPFQITPHERHTLQECLHTGEDQDETGDGIRLHATYVDEGRGVVRVLLIVEES